jgi:hypothetical protein
MADQNKKVMLLDVVYCAEINSLIIKRSFKTLGTNPVEKTQWWLYEFNSQLSAYYPTVGTDTQDFEEAKKILTYKN